MVYSYITHRLIKKLALVEEFKEKADLAINILFQEIGESPDIHPENVLDFVYEQFDRNFTEVEKEYIKSEYVAITGWEESSELEKTDK